MFLRAAAILDTLPHPRAEEVRVKLRDLDGRAEPGTQPDTQPETQAGAATTVR
jgi:hypothetical protein